jgi:hypothetical protein
VVAGQFLRNRLQVTDHPAGVAGSLRRGIRAGAASENKSHPFQGVVLEWENLRSVRAPGTISVFNFGADKTSIPAPLHRFCNQTETALRAMA